MPTTAFAHAAPVTRDEFLHAIRTAEILSSHQLARAIEALPATATLAAHVAFALVSAGVLTRFQADRLLAGRSDGFVLGPYVVQEQVGRGSLGRVFRAKHRTMNRAVAIKMLAKEFTRPKGARESIHREVRAAAQLVHPNIVTAYDANEAGERFYLALEFVDGPSFDEHVKERGPLPIAEACNLARQVALGLDHAHSRDMVHRGIKPRNLLVADSVVKISGFGLAKFSPCADLDYVAPEQARHPEAIDRRSDLYSLGAVLYFLLTGRPVFPGGADDEKVRRHMWDEPERVEAIRPDVPREVAVLVHQLLAKRPEARPARAADVAARLAAIVGAAEPNTLDIFPTTGNQPVVAAETDTSPWSEITVATAALDDCATRSWEFSNGYSRKPIASKVPAWMTGGLAAGIFLTCGIAIWLIVRAAA